MPSSEHPAAGRNAAQGLRPNSGVRRSTAEAYRVAFNGIIDAALTTLDETSRMRDPIDRLHLACAKAHLLYLDGRSDEALLTIEDDIFPLVDQFGRDLREVIDYNRTIVANDCGDWPTQTEIDRHHALVDRRAAVGFKSGEPSKLLDADRAVAEGKLDDALPIYTSAFYNAFDTYDWSTWKEAAGRLSGAVLQSSDVSQATFYAVVSEDDGVVERVVRHLIAQNNAAAIKHALDMLKRKGNLKRHRLMGFKLVEGLGQAMPDHAADEWSELCRSYRTEPIDSRRSKSFFDAAWKVSSAVAPALSRAAADLLAIDALGHPRWSNPSSRVDSFYPSLCAAGPNLSDAICARVIDAVAPCAGFPLQHGFEAATFLLAKLCEERPAERYLVRKALYASDERVPLHLARMASRFDVETPLIDIERVVQQVDSLLDHQISGGDKNASVSIGQDFNPILVVAAYKEQMGRERVDKILARMLDLVEDSRNVNQNRSRMIECAALITEGVSIETGRRAARLYATYAADYRLEGHPLHGNGETEQNLFRMDRAGGRPEDVRGKALIALGVTASIPELVGDLDLEALIHAALEDPNPTVRSHACIAFSRSGTSLRELLPVVLIRAADPATDVARVALSVVAHRIKDMVELSLAGVTLALASTQARHVDQSVRAAAAGVVASLRTLSASRVTAIELRQLETVAERLSADVARSVRRRLTVAKNLGLPAGAAFNTAAEHRPPIPPV